MPLNDAEYWDKVQRAQETARRNALIVNPFGWLPAGTREFQVFVARVRRDNHEVIHPLGTRWLVWEWKRIQKAFGFHPFGKPQSKPFWCTVAGVKAPTPRHSGLCPFCGNRKEVSPKWRICWKCLEALNDRYEDWPQHIELIKWVAGRARTCEQRRRKRPKASGAGGRV